MPLLVELLRNRIDDPFHAGHVDEYHQGRVRRRKALEEAAKVRALARRGANRLVQQIKSATGPALVPIANAGAKDAVKEAEEVAAPAGD